MLRDKAILVTLNLGLPPTARTDKNLTAKLIRDAGASGGLRAVKTILPEVALEAIKRLHGEVRDYHHKHTVPWGENVRMLAAAHFMDYSNQQRQFRQTAEGLADEFTANYQSYIASARRTLNGAFKDSDYPAQGAIRGKFVFKLDYGPVPDGGDLRVSLMKDAMEELRAGIDARVEEAERAGRADVARRLSEPLAAMVNKLSESEAVFRDSLVGNVREMCDLIPALNITGDAALEQIRQRILSDICRADPGMLRENVHVRKATARKAQDILDDMQAAFAA